MSSVPMWSVPVLMLATGVAGWWIGRRSARKAAIAEQAPLRRQIRFDTARARVRHKQDAALSAAGVRPVRLDSATVAGSDLPSRGTGLIVDTTVTDPQWAETAQDVDVTQRELGDGDQPPGNDQPREHDDEDRDGPPASGGETVDGEAAPRYPWPSTPQPSARRSPLVPGIWGRLMSASRRQAVAVAWLPHTRAGIRVRQLAPTLHTAGQATSRVVRGRMRQWQQTVTDWREAAGPATGETWPEGVLRNLRDGAHHHRPGARSLRVVFGHRVPPQPAHRQGRHRADHVQGSSGQRTGRAVIV